MGSKECDIEISRYNSIQFCSDGNLADQGLINRKYLLSITLLDRDLFKMVLFVQSQQTHVLDLSQQKTVGDVKMFVTDREGLPSDQMAVFYEGAPLEDTCQLYSFKNEATLHVELRMLGGKVHGSLARAGKVRGQTPKVEAEEKKKQKTGRANSSSALEALSLAALLASSDWSHLSQALSFSTFIAFFFLMASMAACSCHLEMSRALIRLPC